MKKNPIFEEYERRVLEKYRHGEKVEEQDEDILNRLTLIGLVEWGFNYSEMYPTAKTSNLGTQLLD